MTTTVNLEVSGGGSVGGGGSDYLGPQTMAALQAGAYADGTPELAALAKDTVVYLTDRGQAVTPSPDGTTWTTGGGEGFAAAAASTVWPMIAAQAAMSASTAVMALRRSADCGARTGSNLVGGDRAVNGHALTDPGSSHLRLHSHYA